MAAQTPLPATGAAQLAGGQEQFLPGLALALAIGLLVGIERGWRLRDEEAGGRVAGLRTFAILGLLGGLAGLEIAGQLRLLFLVLAGGTLGALLLGYSADMRRDGNVSVTSTLAAIVTLALGAMATNGHMAAASVGAGATVILLASRDALHRAIRYTSENDIKALLRFVLVVFVILPLLPDAATGPYDALNPRRLWMVVAVTVGISFIGYGLARWLGSRRGTLITGAVGALVSSTAVTLHCARRIREQGPSAPDEAAVALASVIMMGRSLVLVALLAPFAFLPIGTLVLPGLLVGAVGAAVLLWRSRRESAQPTAPETKPPGLALALIFALTVALISVVSAWAETRFGGGGGAAVIALGGTADIDAAIAAVGALPRGSLSNEAIALAIAAPVLFNTAFKLAILLTVARLQAPRAAAALGTSSLALLVSIGIPLL